MAFDLSTAQPVSGFDLTTAKPDTPASVKAGSTLMGIPRQLGLTARYGAEGLAQMAEIGTEPIRNLIVNPVLRAVGAKPAERLSTAVSGAADAVGLPSPQGADERVIGDASRLVAGAGGMAGAAGAAARNTTGVVSNVLNSLAQAPAQQVASAAGAGLAGGSVREAGGGPWAQFLASLAGGVAAPVATNALSGLVTKGANAVKTALTPQTMIDQQVDQQIALTLKKAGVDWSTVSERTKQGMRQEVQDAVTNGEKLDANALNRMLQFKMVEGAKPTRGMISQDPVQITREKNLAKVGANSTSLGLQELPNLESSNTAALLRKLDNAGAAGAPDAYATGSRTINALQDVVDTNKSRIGDLYSAARDTSGKSLPLDNGHFNQRVNQLLDDANVGSFLPPDISKKINAMGVGTPGYELNVSSAEQLKTSIAKLQRGSTDGNVRHALSLVRQALDDTPLAQSMRTNPGNLPAVAGAVPRSEALAGQESIDAFNAARSANREWMAQVESNPALKAVVDGIAPDKFVQKFITGSGATAADVHILRDAASGNPQAVQAIKDNLVAHLKESATGQAGDINKFRADSYNNALNAIGERKLSAFFSPEEIAQLKAVGKVSNYMSAQPAGTAVNNSNSGALAVAKALDMLDKVAGSLPLGLDTMIQGTVRGVQQRQVLNSKNALSALVQPAPRTNNLLALPIIAAGQRTNDR